MQSDELAYLDQLHAKATDKDTPTEDRDRAKRRFLDNVFLIWPEISIVFDADKHSL